MPWQLSYAASADLDNSELQTDVMRFMAILAFCLVAIFAIVQSMPLEPPTPEAAAAVVSPPPVPVVDVPMPVKTLAPKPAAKLPIREPATKPAPPPVKAAVVALPKPKPKPKPVAKPVTSVRTAPLAALPAPPVPKPMYVSKPMYVPTPTPTPDPVTESPVIPEVQSGQAIVTETGQGLSLSFVSDNVLRSLVARRLVGLYAIDGNNFYQMTVNGQQFVFAPGAAPDQYHEMVYETVPAEVSRSLESHLPLSARDVVWGVTLPAGTTRQLRRFVQTNFNGSLVINDDAQLALAGSG